MHRLRSSPPLAGILAVFVLAAFVAPDLAWGHPGGLAQDGCHRVADTDTRHAHAEDSSEPAFFCVDEDGTTVRVPIDPVPAEAVDPITELTRTIAAQTLGLTDERDQLQDRVDKLEARLADDRRSHQLALDGVLAELEQSRADHELTRIDLDAARADSDAADEYAAGLEASLEELDARWSERPEARCRNAVQTVLDLEVGGWSGRILLEDDQRAELSAACIDGI